MAFNLDNTTTDGRICVLYQNINDVGSIWFQDLSNEWNFICDTFENYFRLLILHLGKYSFILNCASANILKNVM